MSQAGVVRGGLGQAGSVGWHARVRLVVVVAYGESE